MKTVKKQHQIFFTKKDEEGFSAKLKETCPSVNFIDGNVWNSPSPIMKNNIHQCNERIVFLWDRDAVPVLPYIRRADGLFIGPTSGVVIQVIRSFIESSCLVSGRVAVGTDASSPEFAKMRDFIKKVWQVLKKMTSSDLLFVSQEEGVLQDTKITGYLVGPDAIAWCEHSKDRFLKDRATGQLCIPRGLDVRNQSDVI